ncbi:MAG: peptide deformylase [Pseudomonadota bacterium]
MTPILMWPDKRLSTPAAPVEAITQDVRAHWKQMIDVMEAMPGVGLAAPQLGIMLRLAVVDASEQRGRAVMLANPEIVEASETLFSHVEGSPCLPGVAAKLSRPERVRVRFLNEAGERETRAFSGLWSTSVQHQIDHLNGQLYVQRLSPTRRKMLMKKWSKHRERG